MRRTVMALAFAMPLSGMAFADVSTSELEARCQQAYQQRLADNAGKPKLRQRRASVRGACRPATRTTFFPGRIGAGHAGVRATLAGTGSISLIDSSGLEYFINTDITFATTSSASGAAAEASYTAAVAATTSGGGTVMSTLSDMFDGYATLEVNGTTYNDNGGPPATECGGRQVVFPVQVISGLNVSRKVFVPGNDSFILFMNIINNPTAAPIAATVASANNLGSGASTAIVTTSSGDPTATIADEWVTTFQAFSMGISSDPRLGHVLQGLGAPVPLATVNFTSGDDNPSWSYDLNVPPGGTQIVVWIATGQPSLAAAAAQAANLAMLPATTTQCMTAIERSQVVNFAPAGTALPPWAFATLAAMLLLGGSLAVSRRRQDITV